MNLRTTILAVFIIIIGLDATAQLVNQYDEQGMKQGVWRKVFPGGILAYEVNFIDDKPVGDYKRYHENGKLSAYLIYEEDGKTAPAKFYDELGNLTATGFYYGKAKDSTWHYFTKDSVPVLTENYIKGVKEGQFVSYYPSGKPCEIEIWKDNKLEGRWQRFFEKGTVNVEAKLVNGKRNGSYYEYYPTGRPKVKGLFTNGLPSGKWIYYNKDGIQNRTEEYLNGKPTNWEELEKAESERLKALEKNHYKLKDPEKYKGNPDEYMFKQGGGR